MFNLSCLHAHPGKRRFKHTDGSSEEKYLQNKYTTDECRYGRRMLGLDYENTQIHFIVNILTIYLSMTTLPTLPIYSKITKDTFLSVVAGIQRSSN